jgi:transcriptional/translational regulatory protein YebC/TACO1
MFKRKGVIAVEKSQVDEDRLMEIALEEGADDVEQDDGTFQITTSPDAFEAVKAALEGVKLTIATAAVSMVPQNTQSLTGTQAEHTLKLLDELEDHDDVQDVASNIDISQEELERLSAA